MGNHIVFHCNISVGTIFEGSEDECRAYVMAHPMLVHTSIIMDDDEYQTTKAMSENQIREKFAHLEMLSRAYTKLERVEEVDLLEIAQRQSKFKKYIDRLKELS